MNILPDPATVAAGEVAGSPARDLRAALGQFATGVTVVTTLSADGEFFGLTANSFSALSLDPPLILWSLRLGSSSLPVFQRTVRFVVNVLTDAQVPISSLFASSAPDKFSQVAYSLNAQGLPLLHAAAAWFDCRQVSQQTAGDHCLFIAEVERFSFSGEAPLLFHGGAYYSLGSAI